MLVIKNNLIAYQRRYTLFTGIEHTKVQSNGALRRNYPCEDINKEEKQLSKDINKEKKKRLSEDVKKER